MPSALTYPGVYVEEIPSGVRTITGVATSITAFIGRTERGPVNKATTITSFADYERIFGVVKPNWPVAYTVRDFFLNGGAQGIVVRAFKGTASTSTSAIDVGTDFKIVAMSPGTWGKDLFILCDQIRVTGDAFNVRVLRNDPDRPGKKVVLESFVGVSLQTADRRYIVPVLERESNLVRAVLGQNPQKPAGMKTNDADTVDADFKQLTGGADSADLAKADFLGSQSDKTGMYALEDADLFNLLCIPPDKLSNEPVATNSQTPGDLGNIKLPDLLGEAAAYCAKRRAMLIADPLGEWHSNVQALKGDPRGKRNELGVAGADARNAMVYYPMVVQADSARDGLAYVFPACGILAGVFAKTDTARGVWKAPAGLDAGLVGIRKLAVNLTDAENGLLNPVGINCLRFFAAGGNVVWGARTLRGDDQLGDEYKYIPIRRLALYIEESLYRGTQWAVFEPNDEPLWAQLRLNIGAFMQDLFRLGAFQGKSPREAYFVKCDKETTTQSDDEAEDDDRTCEAIEGHRAAFFPHRTKTSKQALSATVFRRG